MLPGVRPVVGILAAALALSVGACSRQDPAVRGTGGAEGAGPGGTTADAPAQGEGGAGATAPGGSRPAPAGGGGASSGDGQQPVSPIIDVRGTVASVDRAAGLIRLQAPDGGYGVIEVTPSTEYRLSEGEPATLADVMPGSVVVGTGLGQDGRLRSRLVTILTY